MTDTVYGLPEDKYFATPAASNSTLGRMAKSPAHCKAYMEAEHEPTASMALGSLVHALVLEPETVTERYHVSDENDPARPRAGTVQEIIAAIYAGNVAELFTTESGPRKPTGMALSIAELIISGEGIEKHIVEPAMNKKSNEGKLQYAEFAAQCEREGLTICKQEHIDRGAEYANHQLENQGKAVIKDAEMMRAQNYVNFLAHINGKEIVSPEIMETARECAASVMAHPTASKLFAKGKSEVSLFWVDEETGHPCKARVDFLNASGYIVDLKTTRDASPEGFGKSMFNFGYHRQEAFYSDGYEACFNHPAKAFLFVAVETEAPYAVAVYQLDSEGVDLGRTQYRGYLNLFAECSKKDHWPAYDGAVQQVSLPAWAK